LKGGRYRVKIGRRIVARRTTKRKAERQRRLLQAIDHGWRPSRRRKK
jgi:hypothetical protein